MHTRLHTKPRPQHCAGVCRREAASEGISDAEVERGIFPAQVVNPPFARRIVGIVELHAPVEPEHGELDVETQPQSGVESQLLIKLVEKEDGVVEYSEGFRRIYQILPRSKKVAPCTMPQIGKRSSRLASSLTSPVCIGKESCGLGTDP